MQLNLKVAKKYLIMLTSITLLSFPCFASTIQINLNGSPLATPVAPIQEHGTTLVPLRIISENLGAIVDYDKTSQQITITKDEQSIVLTLDKTHAVVNNKEYTLTLAPRIIENTTMVPLRFVSEHLNCTVDWDATAQLITINSIEYPIATLTIKDYGAIELELYPDMAPQTVENFINLANTGFYDGLTFHRIVPGFVIQGGDPTGLGNGTPGYTIPGEFASNGFASNTLSHTKGVISMARTSDPNSAGSQFFIMSGDATYLDGEYAAFGKVISGLEIIDQVQSVETDAHDYPLTDIIIENIRVNTH